MGQGGPKLLGDLGSPEAGKHLPTSRQKARPPEDVWHPLRMRFWMCLACCLVACGGGSSTDTCTTTADCPSGQRCVDETCVPITERDAGGCTDCECTTDDDCCTGANCHFSCSVTVAGNGGTDTVVGRRCVLVDYSWCTHQYVRRDDKLPAGEDYVYLDRCNGYDGPDGYAYHTTLTFPFMTGCLRGAADDYVADRGDGGMNMMGLPMCMPGQMMCCGDGICGGPENAQNCSADCP